MTRRENYLKAIRFETPEYIPMRFAINAACWAAYPQDELCRLTEDHPFLFPNDKRPSPPILPVYANVAQKGHPYRDDFGCVWTTTVDGITGAVTQHPLADWAAFGRYRPPDPDICTGIGPIDWDQEKASIAAQKRNGDVAQKGLRHGHTFLQLCDIRGYQNLLFDMVDGDPRLLELIRLVEEFNLAIVHHYLDCEVDVLTYGEDLGMQVGPMLSPRLFRQYIKPSYERIMKPARDGGVIVHMHSDGDIRTLADDLIDGGVQVINLQDLVNGVEWIADRFAGKLCVDLDLDRQSVTRYGTPAEIDALVRQEVTALARKEGGMMMVFGLYPGTPLENVGAIMDAMERYACYYC